MALIRFTANHQDLSTYRGYQFKFFCDRCGNGYETAHQASWTGLAGIVLGALDYLGCGGWFRSWWLAGELKDYGLRGKPHDDAFARAVAECQGHFHQCPRCAKWVCPESCWNGEASLCRTCAPVLETELAAHKAHALSVAAGEQALAQARSMDFGDKLPRVYGGGAEVHFCPECGTEVHSGRFCSSCGKPLHC